MNSIERADAGLEELYGELVAAKLPCDLVVASNFLRAAYVRGYCDALELQKPPTHLEVIAFRDELALRVPVS